jgi:phenylpropionate dioxygenase-like ring-hydroxylating dioxygenase large terminal subunit
MPKPVQSIDESHLACMSTNSQKAAWREVLQQTAAEVLQHKAKGTFPLTAEVMTLPAETYTCSQQFELEKRKIFRRLPLVLAASCELPAVGDFKTLHVAGVPVLITRGRDGRARAFLNSCTHRGANVASGCGSARRFVCPYHGWTFDDSGALIGLASAEDFGQVDKADLGLKAFPTIERAGLIWCILDTASYQDPAVLLGGIDSLLAEFGLEDWTHVESRVIEGPNWKLAFDAHLEFYHLPVLHRETFGADRSNRALYFYHGQHQRLVSPKTRADIPPYADLLAQNVVPQDGPETEALLAGEWIVFPAVSFNSFYSGGKRGLFMSQVFPGANVGESVTIQTYLSSTPPNEQEREQISALFDVLEHAVGSEDIPTSFKQQDAMGSGMVGEVRFGRNEGGLQHFHRWIAAVVAAEDAELASLLGPQNVFG